jgi:hypothetical protein
MKWRNLFMIKFAAVLLLIGLTGLAAAEIAPDSLYAILAPGQSITETKVVTIPELPPKVDVVFSFDLTGSMSGIIDTAKAKASQILTALSGIPGIDVRFGVISYMDYPAFYTCCGYSNSYGCLACGDYPYELNQTVTDDEASVVAAINGLTLGNGEDLPQDYTRIFYESYADSNVGWRPGAKRILVNFGDNVPHDCNLNEGVTTGTWTTGCDPGRDGVAGTADDLDLQTVLNEMAANGVVLLEAHTTSYANEYWTYWTGLTGGSVFITTSATLVDDIVAAVQAALEASAAYGLHLEKDAGCQLGLTTDPESYPGPLSSGDTADFDVTITVPGGTAPGIYNCTISARDDVGVGYGDQAVQIVVYDPSAGFVTGGGWIYSPMGAYTPDLALEGKANFGFISKYKKGATAPTGNTEFQFHAGNLNFHSSSYDWLIVTGSNYARFKGMGAINGEGEYKFMLWAGDGNPDTFRIKIWTEDLGTEDVVYDNGFDQPIEGGSIVMHK